MPILQSSAEVVDPLILDAKIVEPHHPCHCGCCCELNEVPPSICRMFGQDIILGDNGRKLFVTLGQFCIIRLERDIQLLMPAYDICLPERDCSCSGNDAAQDPCDIFDRFEFPVDEFFPPRCEATSNSDCGCGSGSGSACGCGPGSGSACGSSSNNCGPNHGGGKRNSCC